MLSAQGKLTIIDGRKVYWNGAEVLGVNQIILHAEDDEVQVKMHIRGTQTDVYAAMTMAGIKIKEV